MAASELVILSSSPLSVPTDFAVTPPGAQAANTCFELSSSPGLPSPSRLIEKRVGGAGVAFRASKPLGGANNGFTTAGALIESDSCAPRAREEGANSGPEGERTVQRRAAAGPKRVAGAVKPKKTWTAKEKGCTAAVSKRETSLDPSAFAPGSHQPAADDHAALPMKTRSSVVRAKRTATRFEPATIDADIDGIPTTMTGILEFPNHVSNAPLYPPESAFNTTGHSKRPTVTRRSPNAAPAEEGSPSRDSRKADERKVTGGQTALEHVDTVVDVGSYKNFRACDMGTQEELPSKKVRRPRTTKKSGSSTVVSGLTEGGAATVVANAISAAGAAAANDSPASLEVPAKTRKPRAKKNSTETQTKLNKGRVTKPRARSGNAEKPLAEKPVTKKEMSAARGRNTDQTVSVHFQHQDTEPSALHGPGKITIRDENLDLDQATTKRTNWTPPRDTKPVTFSDLQKLSKVPFTELLGNFGYNETHGPRLPQTRSPDGKAPRKRRRVELVGPTRPNGALNQTVAPVPPAKKAKSPKKKPRTITELATSAYRSIEQVSITANPVNEFFAPRSVVSPVIVSAAPAEVPVTVKKRRAPRSKSLADAGQPPKKSTKITKPKKAVPILPKLLSPQTASKKMDRQDFLFGTSSQLAREESPTFIRDLQHAMRESETVMDGEEGSQPTYESYESVPTAPHGTSLSIVQTRRGLWAAAARDPDRQMLAADWRVRRLPSSAVNSKMADEESQDSGVADMEPVSITGLDMEEADDDTLPESGVGDLAQPPACNNGIDAPSEQEMQDSGFVDIDTFEKDPGRHDEKDECMVLKSDDSHDKVNPHVHDCSIAKTTPTQLAGESASLASNLPSLSTSTNLASTKSDLLPTASITIQKELSARVTHEPLSQAKKPRGRPRKALVPNGSTTNSSKPQGRPHEDLGRVTSALTKRKRNTTILPSTAPASLDQDGWLNIDEISDSDTPPTPSPPRRRASHSPVALQPLEFDAPVPPTAPDSASTSKAGEKPDWAATSAALFPRITHTIRSAPATSTPSKPSWHTKILLYDPLPLEDFTAWLNAQGVRYAGTETETVLVERKDGKGARKKREMKCVRKELEVEAWMVQKWCEEMGVCCFSRESGRGGAKARY